MTKVSKNIVTCAACGFDKHFEEFKKGDRKLC